MTVSSTESLSLATPADLRSRLFGAIYPRSRTRCLPHPWPFAGERISIPGEYLYFRCFCHFRSGQFQDAIEFAKRVPLPLQDVHAPWRFAPKATRILGSGRRKGVDPPLGEERTHGLPGTAIGRVDGPITQVTQRLSPRCWRSSDT